MNPPSAVLLFHPEPYGSGGSRPMGRHHAGHAFFRAFVEARDGPVCGMGHQNSSAAAFAQAVAVVDRHAPTEWIPAHDVARLARHDVLSIPGPGLSEQADLRLRHGVAAWSLVGVTHTLSTVRVIGEIAAMLSKPVMPWDALICTSTAARSVVETILEIERARLSALLGATRFPRFMLPVIPLGVHARDFDFGPERRAQARERLGVAPDEVLAISTGRLSFHAKAHPLPMYVGLQGAAERTGRKVALAQSSWFANEGIEGAFKSGAARFCPSVRTIWSDGADAQARADVWAAGDLFISLSDNIQETFGLTPVEAMAAGLPAVVTDWDGYRDTVRDGLDGFRIPTAMPSPPFGADIARRYQEGALSYDGHCAATSIAVSLDIGVLTDRLAALVDNADLRHRLGASGRERVRSDYDWPVVLRRYKELWAECRTIRLAEGGTSHSKAPPPPGGTDPFALFASYPTRSVCARTVVRAGSLLHRWTEIRNHTLFGHVPMGQPRFTDLQAVILGNLGPGGQGRSLAEIAGDAALPLDDVILAAAVLAKAGALVFESDTLSLAGNAQHPHPEEPCDFAWRLEGRGAPGG